ncbi:MAG: AraC family transcriptional regulator [Sumerlaeia bacterium]
MAHPGCAILRETSVSLAGISTLRTRYEIGRLDPRFHVLLLTTGGRAKLWTETGEHCLQPGGFTLLPAGHIYRYHLDGKFWDVAWLHLLDRKRWQVIKKSPIRIGSIKNESEILFAMKSIIREGHSHAVGSRRLTQLHSESLLLYLDRLLENHLVPPANPYEEHLRGLWHDVERDLAHPWTVPRLAQRLHVAPGHLNRLVRDLCGSTPMRVVTTLRMKRAETLLRHTPLPIFQIAELVGYADPFAFSTAYKRATGRSPSAERKAAGLRGPL